MFITSVLLGRINQSVSLTFSVILDGDAPRQIETQGGEEKINGIVKYQTYNGNTNLKITPYPYIKIDIRNWETKKDYDPYDYANLNVRGLGLLIDAANFMYNQYTTHGGEWYKKDNVGNCYMDDETIRRYTVTVPNKERTIRISPAWVPVDQTTEMRRGFILYINNFDHFAYLSINDFIEFKYILEHANLTELTLLVLQLDATYKSKTITKIHNVEFARNENEVYQAPTATPMPANMIPDI